MNLPFPLLILIIITAIISFVGFKNYAIFDKYKFQVSAIKNDKEYIRLLSAGFLHADMMHLFFNMLTLYFFGPLVLQVFGISSFFIVYLGSIILGNVFSLYLYQNRGYYSAIGASGGVSGVLFAAVSIDPVAIEVNFLPGYLFGALYFGYSVYMMLYPKSDDNIGHAAHLGGAAFGLVFSFIAMPELAMHHAKYLGIMSLPLFFMAYQVFVKKKIS